jgi:hypothetical protein
MAVTDVKGAAPAGKAANASPATAQQVTAAFDQKFPWSTGTHALNGNNSDMALPKENIDPSTLPGEAGKMYAEIKKNKNYSNLQVAWINGVAGEKVLAMMGTNGNPPSDCGLALFDSKGKQLAFKDVMGLNQWQFDGKGNAHNMALGAGLPGANHGGGRQGTGKGGWTQDDGPSGQI